MFPKMKEYFNIANTLVRGMEIYFSIDNNKEILRLPYIPPDIDFDIPLTFENFETTSGRTLTLIGEPGLRTLTIDSFFPIRFYRFLGNVSLAPDCIDFFTKNRKEKLRIVIISSSINLNMKCIVTNFKYSKKHNEDVKYSISIQEYIDPSGGSNA